MRKRVYCLYRVSTKGQVEKDDIPMQRQTCREFAGAQNWEVVREFVEKGVSGYKVSAKDRDEIQEIQKDAVQGKFDILLVFMFDRIGRKEDETPFVVEWFARNGIEVWSATEGQQRFDNHVDKLMNYIRYWQASGESIKTSIRTKTRLGQIVQEGRFRGGVAAYGYELIKKGRLGKKNRELFEIEINEAEAIVVRKIFNYYVQFGYGGRRIASELAKEGILNRNGELFHYSTIQNILKNIMYVGILRSGDTKSEIFPDLQIVDLEIFSQANKIIEQRSNKYQQERNLPKTVHGNALLSGNVFCGHCGGRIFASTARTSNHLLKDGSTSDRLPIYKCYNKTQHGGLCEGPTTYRAYKIDNVIKELITRIFDNIKGINECDLIDQKYKEQMKEFSIGLKNLKSDYEKKSKELMKLDEMILGASEGSSQFTPERLMRRMDAVEGELENLKIQISETECKMEESSQLLDQIRKTYSDLISWAEVFSGASNDMQKMIASYLIKKVTVSRDYELDIEYNFDEGQFIQGLGL